MDDQAVGPEEYVSTCNNADKTLVVSLTTSEPLCHPSSLFAWSYTSISASLILTTDPKSDVFFYCKMSETLGRTTQGINFHTEQGTS